MPHETRLRRPIPVAGNFSLLATPTARAFSLCCLCGTGNSILAIGTGKVKPSRQPVHSASALLLVPSSRLQTCAKYAADQDGGAKYAADQAAVSRGIGADCTLRRSCRALVSGIILRRCKPAVSSAIDPLEPNDFCKIAPKKQLQNEACAETACRAKPSDALRPRQGTSQRLNYSSAAATRDT